MPAMTARFRGFPTVMVVSHRGFVPKPFGSLGTASPVFGSEAQGIEFWAHGDGSFRQFSSCLGGNNRTFALLVPAVWLGTQIERQS